MAEMVVEMKNTSHNLCSCHWSYHHNLYLVVLELQDTYSHGRKVVVASGTCTCLPCQVQLLTDGCEELRICLAQHGGHLSWHLVCFVTAGLCFWVLQNFTEVEQVLHVFETASTCEVWHGRKQHAGWQNNNKKWQGEYRGMIEDESERNKPNRDAAVTEGQWGGLVV